MPKLITDNSKCEYPGCNCKAACLAWNRKDEKVGKYCQEHYEAVIVYGHPEYLEECPNCGCGIPVN